MFLESLYRSLFRPLDAPLALGGAGAIAIFALLAVTLALPDAGRLGTGGFGAFGLWLLVFASCLAGWFWAGAGVTLLARLAGGRGSVEATMGAVAQACWPLLLLAPAVGAGNAGLPQMKAAATLAIGAWVAVLLVAFVRQVHALSWGRTILAWLALAGASVLTALVAMAAAGVLAAVWLTT